MCGPVQKKSGPVCGLVQKKSDPVCGPVQKKTDQSSWKLVHCNEPNRSIFKLLFLTLPGNLEYWAVQCVVRSRKKVVQCVVLSRKNLDYWAVQCVVWSRKKWSSPWSGPVANWSTVMDRTGPFLSPCFWPPQEIWNMGQSSVWCGPEKSGPLCGLVQKKWSSVWSGPKKNQSSPWFGPVANWSTVMDQTGPFLSPCF